MTVYVHETIYTFLSFSSASRFLTKIQTLRANVHIGSGTHRNFFEWEPRGSLPKGKEEAVK